MEEPIKVDMSLSNAPQEVQDKFDSRYIDEWCTDMPNKKTARHYSYTFGRFCRTVHLRPWQVVAMPDSQLDDIIHHWILDMKRNADNYTGKYNKDRKGKLSVNSIPSVVSGVRSFCEYYEKAVHWHRYMKKLPEKLRNNLRSYRREEIQELLSFADVRLKTAILLMVSSGVRVAGLAELKVRDLMRVPKEETNIGVEIGIIRIYDSSAKYRYVSFTTPECLKAVDTYLNYRKHHGENLTEDSPLIRNQFSPLRNSQTNRAKHMTAEGIRVQMKYLMVAAHLPMELLQPDHSFRKFFNTMAKNAGIDHMYKEMFMGHSIKLDHTYYDIEVPESRKRLIEEYKKAIDLLTISDEFRLSKEVLGLKEQIKDAPKIQQLEQLVLQREITMNNLQQTMAEVLKKFNEKGS
jgi:integrase